MTSVALLAALAYAVRSARISGLSARAMYWAVVCSLLAGLWGAHVLSLLVHGWQGGPLALLQFVQGGKSLFGGLLLGGLAAGLYFHVRKLPILAYSDAAMPAVALGYAIGRIGCFLNGDDYGTLTHAPWVVCTPQELRPTKTISPVAGYLHRTRGPCRFIRCNCTRPCWDWFCSLC